ncbi:hypothetical protein BC835DRAFT_1346012 [Cytidiella melzeri]|nr:hypothetical protein BC835DRAFT_1346012 [Cytidiella melzeri]
MTDSSETTVRTTPSAKAAGKRPAMGMVSPPQIHPNAKAAVQTRQKRVLPSRSRRGGPGVGGCDVDVMILETRKRRFDSEPLIPSATKFLLTTKSSLVPPPPEGGSSRLEVNVHAYGRYFDRPEVQQACKYQQLIQTPEYTQLPDDAIVGGRFRPRGSEDETADTSDAAYQKRHRKYETFEKRQRLREKEKLKHEEYKLKERIEQLRAMDTSAFLALPASKFSEPPGVSHDEISDETDPGLADLPGAHVNGAAAYNEGERRRKEMLDIAQGLEERYRVLLPPDRKWAEKKAKAKRESISQSTEPDSQLHDVFDEGHSPGEAEMLIDDRPEVHTPPASVPEFRSQQGNQVESEATVDADKDLSKRLRLRIKFRPRPTEDTSSHITSHKFSKSKATVQTVLPFTSVSAPPVADPLTRANLGRGANGRFVTKSKLQDIESTVSRSASQSPPKKRLRPGSPPSPTHSRHSHASMAKTPCMLMVAATRNATTPAARKTHRHVTAFGVRVPQELEEIRDYDLPDWLHLEDDSGSERYSYEDFEDESPDWRDGQTNVSR